MAPDSITSQRSGHLSLLCLLTNDLANLAGPANLADPDIVLSSVPCFLFFTGSFSSAFRQMAPR